VRRSAALVGTTLCLMTVAAGEEAGPYAQIAPLAPHSLLLDAARAGSRLVVVGERGHVLFSDDAGQSWRQARVPTLSMLTGVFFVDARLGWAVGHDEVILRSEDGGENWARVHYAPENEQPLLDVWFRDARYGLAVGAYGAILCTEDGGLSWTRQEFSPAESTQGATDMDTVEGETQYEYDDALAGDRHLNKIARSGPGRLYLAAEAGFLFRSDDDGRHWTTLPSPYDGSFFGVLPLAGDALLAFGLRGHLFRSQDGGDNWTQLPVLTTAMLTDAARLDAGTVVISGLAGVMLISRDDGNSFELWQQPGRRGVQAALELDADRLLTVGEGGVAILDLVSLEPARPDAGEARP
jgi:photosystem II stability/assembly factor-like uncharacterized protein